MARVRHAVSVSVVVSLVLAACGGSGANGGNGEPPNTPPVADAGRAQVALRNVVVVLDGGASHDADGDPLIFRWSMVSRPGGTAWGLNAFADQGDGTVVDSMSGLRWQQVDDGVARTWASALDHCEQLSLAGHGDWRLPDVKELESLVYLQPGEFTTPVDSAHFTPRTDGSGVSFYWSSTTTPGSFGAALGVEFWAGSVEDGGFGKASYKFARCVR